jgi:hypothetical protein
MKYIVISSEVAHLNVNKNMAVARPVFMKYCIVIDYVPTHKFYMKHCTCTYMYIYIYVYQQLNMCRQSETLRLCATNFTVSRFIPGAQVSNDSTAVHDI